MPPLNALLTARPKRSSGEPAVEFGAVPPLCGDCGGTCIVYRVALTLTLAQALVLALGPSASPSLTLTTNQHNLPLPG